MYNQQSIFAVGPNEVQLEAEHDLPENRVESEFGKTSTTQISRRRGGGAEPFFERRANRKGRWVSRGRWVATKDGFRTGSWDMAIEIEGEMGGYRTGDGFGEMAAASMEMGFEG